MKGLKIAGGLTNIYKSEWKGAWARPWDQAMDDPHMPVKKVQRMVGDNQVLLKSLSQ